MIAPYVLNTGPEHAEVLTGGDHDVAGRHMPVDTALHPGEFPFLRGLASRLEGFTLLLGALALVLGLPTWSVPLCSWACRITDRALTHGGGLGLTAGTGGQTFLFTLAEDHPWRSS